MKRNLSRWSLSVVFCLGFMVSVSHADMSAILCALGLSDGVVSTQGPVAQFAINRPYDAPRTFAGDDIVLNSAADSLVPVPLAADQTIGAFPSSGNTTMTLVICVGENSYQSDMATAVLPALLRQAVDGRPEDSTITTIVLEVRLSTGVPAQVQQRDAVQLVAPQFVDFPGARKGVSLRNYTQPIEIARARGPVK